MENLIRKKYQAIGTVSNIFEFLPDFPSCFHNFILESVVNNVLFAFENRRNVFLVGKEGCGLTHLTRWLADSSFIQHYKKANCLCFICSPETTIAD
jgi:hypothetical protein